MLFETTTNKEKVMDAEKQWDVIMCDGTAIDDLHEGIEEFIKRSGCLKSLIPIDTGGCDYVAVAANYKMTQAQAKDVYSDITDFGLRQ